MQVAAPCGRAQAGRSTGRSHTDEQQTTTGGTREYDVLLRAAIGYRPEPPEIHLDFTTDAENLAEVERVIERVNEIIVGETPMKFELAKLCPAGSLQSFGNPDRSSFFV